MLKTLDMAEGMEDAIFVPALRRRYFRIICRCGREERIAACIDITAVSVYTDRCKI